MKQTLILIIALISWLGLQAQNQIGSPQIINYSNLNYRAGTQNWDTGQDQHGVMYFGNNEGLLSFNGKFWQIYPLPNRTVVRSLEISRDGRIYVGGQDEIGYFFPNQSGILTYHSLKEYIPKEHQQFADVWNIELINEDVFFRSINKILHLKNGKFKVFNPTGNWVYLGKIKNRIFAQESNRGLLAYNNGIWENICSDPLLKGITITAILDYSFDTFLVTTLKHGLFLLRDSKLIPKKTALDATFQNDRVYCAITANKDWYVLGTTSGGVLILNREGELVQKYSFPEGLQKNNIRNVFIDQNKNLWLGLDDGIDFMAINSAIRSIDPLRNLQLTSYAIRMFKNRLYIGTSNGLYRSSPINSTEEDISLLSGTFNEVANTKGQVWGLGEINDNLLLAHEDGAFVIKENKAEQIYTGLGTWLFNELPVRDGTQAIIAGTYNGLQKIQYENGFFTSKGRIEGINDPLRFTYFDATDNSVWASHPYHGIYKIDLTSDHSKIRKTSLYTKDHGLPSTLYNYVFRVRNKIIIGTEAGIYEFNKATKRFIKSPELYETLKKTPIQYIKEDNSGNIWFVTNKEVGIIDFNQVDGEYSVVYFPEISFKVVGGFESIYPLDDSNIFIGSTKGVFHLNYKKYLQNINKLSLLISKVRAIGSSEETIFGGYFVDDDKTSTRQKTDSKVEISSDVNTMHFEYASTLYEQQDNIEFSYQLVGFDADWSSWSDRSEKDYTNLSPGSYTFLVKARNNLGNASEPASFEFRILPSWYQSTLAYLLYFLLFLSMIRLIVKWQQNRHIKEKEKLTYLHQLELERNESEIVKLKNEKLEADVNFKNKELASTTMHLVQRGKVLGKIKEVVSNLEKMPDAENNSSDFKQIFRLLNEVEKRDADWDQFAMHFDHVHSNFLSDIKDRHPNITANELKLCAYLKMNLSSKEIAQLMSITIRAVEVSRYRLRKKLQLPTDVNLFDYLMQTAHKESTEKS